MGGCIPYLKSSRSPPPPNAPCALSAHLRLLQPPASYHPIAVCFQFGIALPPVSASLASPDGLFSSVSGPLRIVCELVVFVHAMSKLKSEGIELRNGGLWGYFGVGGALLLENITSMTYCSAILVTVVARIIGDRMMESASLALASFACWFYLPYFCMGFRLTGPFVVMLITMMHSDIPAFLLVAVTFLGAFASALFILSQEVGFEAMLTNFQVCLPWTPRSF